MDVVWDLCACCQRPIRLGEECFAVRWRQETICLCAPCRQTLQPLDTAQAYADYLRCYGPD